MFVFLSKGRPADAGAPPAFTSTLPPTHTLPHLQDSMGPWCDCVEITAKSWHPVKACGNPACKVKEDEAPH